MQRFVVVRDLHLPEIEGIGIDALETVGLLGNNGLLQMTNSLLSVDFYWKRTLVTVYRAKKGYHVRHSGLRLVRLVGIKEHKEIIKRSEVVKLTLVEESSLGGGG